VKRRTIRIATMLSLLAVVSAGLFACGSAVPGDGTTTTSTGPGDDSAAVLTIEQARAAEPGHLIRVTGAVVATGTEVSLASVLLDSYPPQAGGATVPVEGLDLDSLVGLSSTADQPDLAQVTWSDYWVVLEGVIKDGVLEVGKTPRVVEAASAEARVRFSPVTEPLARGESVWWAFDVTNLSERPLSLTFSSGQRGEVALSQDGVEKYRWSEGKAFTEAIETVTLQPGKGLSVVLNDALQVEPGDYELTATVTAAVGAESATTALPTLTTTLRVH
jgi:hypothetical protein